MCFSGAKNHIFWDHGYVGAWAENRGFGTPKECNIHHDSLSFNINLITTCSDDFQETIENLDVDSHLAIINMLLSTSRKPFVLYSKSLKIFQVHSREHFQSQLLKWLQKVLIEVYSKYF